MKYLKTILSAIVIQACFSLALVQADEFRIEFDWYSDMKKCFSRESPEIFLFNVPEGTTELRVKLVDRDSPGYNHGKSKVPYDGEASIPQGGLKYWKGPCPPNEHRYVVIVEARAGKKKVGKADFERRFAQ